MKFNNEAIQKRDTEANQVLMYGHILQDLRNERNFTRLYVLAYNGQRHIILKNKGEIDEFATGKVTFTGHNNSKSELLKMIDKLYVSGDYQSGGGVLKEGAKAQYQYLEFMLSL